MTDALYGLAYLAAAFIGLFTLYCLLDWVFALLWRIPAVRRKIKSLLWR